MNILYSFAPNTNTWIDPFGLRGVTVTRAPKGSAFDYILKLDSSVYPETAGHIKNAIRKGCPSIVTIDRDDPEAVKKRRNDSLKNKCTKKGKDRDEWPMAMFAEGGTNNNCPGNVADVELIGFSDNRGAGKSIQLALANFLDGTKVKFKIV